MTRSFVLLSAAAALTACTSSDPSLAGRSLDSAGLTTDAVVIGSSGTRNAWLIQCKDSLDRCNERAVAICGDAPLLHSAQKLAEPTFFFRSATGKGDASIQGGGAPIDIREHPDDFSLIAECDVHAGQAS